MINKEKEEEQIVGDHAAPGGSEPEPQQPETNKSAGNADSPHADDIIDKRSGGFSDTLHQALHDNRDAVKRFGDGDHPQNGCAKPDYVFIPAENPDQRFRNQGL